MSTPVIFWFRRDLRLDDNIGLHEAIKTGQPVILLYIIDPYIRNSERFSHARMAFLLSAMQAVNQRLVAYNTQLLVRHGNPHAILPQLIEQSGADKLYFNADYTPFAMKRDTLLQQELPITVKSFDDAILIPPGGVMKDDGSPYVVFTPFKKRWNEKSKPSMSSINLSTSHMYDISNLQNDGIPTCDQLDIQTNIPIPPADESYAQNRLTSYMKSGINTYSTARNYLPNDPFNDKRPAGSSYLSHYFRLGILSPRQAYWAAREKYSDTTNTTIREAIETWISEITWREFYMHIMAHFPHVDRHDFRDTYEAVNWRTAPNELQAWKDGNTGYPIIDAPMRQLKAIGWMPNRARMIVASFLTKDLLIHWREGEKHFMQYLLDGDPAANNGGWQWSASTGTDAQPYFRIFNPVSQSKKFDKNGDYIRHWIPELRDVPNKFIHEPWMMPTPPATYPAPIVDHKLARERTLEAFKTAKEATGA
jgi:deoxyribodipyrimidine photo-lyase